MKKVEEVAGTELRIDQVIAKIQGMDKNLRQSSLYNQVCANHPYMDQYYRIFFTYGPRNLGCLPLSLGVGNAVLIKAVLKDKVSRARKL
ncbi:hypothetical protein PTKIN_Ptkin04bG0048300 [Pterospermum kingtungense]